MSFFSQKIGGRNNIRDRRSNSGWVLISTKSVKVGKLISEEEFVALRFDALLFECLASLCDYGIGSTAPIKIELNNRVQRREAFVIQNGLDDSFEAFAQMGAEDQFGSAPSSEVTIFYGSGSRSHSGNFEDGVAVALLKVLSENPNVVFKVVGPLALPSQFDRIASVRRSPPLELSAYIEELKTASIALLPLAGNDFSKAKSNIKWLEAAALGIPSAVSGGIFTSEVIGEEEAVFCFTELDWYSSLTKLAISIQYREGIGKRARSGALKRYGKDSIKLELRNALDAIAYTRRDEPGNNALRVVVVNIYFAPQAYGGATRVVIDDILEMRKLYQGDIEFSVFTSIQGAQEEGTVRLYSHDNILICGVKAHSANYIVSEYRRECWRVFWRFS